MFTSIDKALIAGFASLAFLAKAFGGIDLGISTETFGSFIAVALPVLVYFVPNKPWAAK